MEADLRPLLNQLRGHIISIDREAHKQMLADANLRQAGLSDVVDLVCGDAAEVAANLPGALSSFQTDSWSSRCEERKRG